MGLLDSIFGGASNQFTQERAFAPGTQATVQNLQPQIAQTFGQYNAANQGEMNLAQVLQNQMYGHGPNVAQNMLNQTTGQNVAQQAALMAGSRGAGANAGLIARQAAQQGGAAQQQAAGQAATLAAQQQLGAQGALANVYGNVANQANQAQSIQQQALASQNAQIVNANNAYNQLGMQQAQQNAQMNQGLIGGLANVGMKVAGFLHDGGAVKGYADGGQTQDNPSIFGKGSGFGGGSAFGFNTNFITRQPPKATPMGVSSVPLNPNIYGGSSTSPYVETINPVMAGEKDMSMAHAAQGGQTEFLPFSPMAYGGAMPVQDMKQGGHVPGQPKHNFDTVKNDVVPAMLTPKEIVLPLSVTQSQNAPEEAAKFVAKELQKHGENDFKGALERSIKSRKK